MTVCETQIVQPGKRGGASLTTPICCSKTYSQTLFLGCSIKSFNASLGWGAEASTLTVELIYDNCQYPQLRDRNGQVVPVSQTSNDYTIKRANNSFAKDDLGNSLIPGKVYYIPEGNRLVSKYWTAADPGFYGDMPFRDHNREEDDLTVDIIGCAVYFKYDDFEFNGVVKNWQNTGGANGIKSYTVIIESPAFLLNQTQMILGDYDGALFVKNSSQNFPLKGFPALVRGQYRGDIIDQAIPNVINIYGYLEDITNVNTNLPVNDYNIPEYRYGASGRNENGIQAINVISALNDLLNSENFLQKEKILRYSTFGRIIGITPKIKRNYDDVNFGNPLFSMGLIRPVVYPPTNKLRMPYTVDISEINRRTNIQSGPNPNSPPVITVEQNIIPRFYRISENKLSILDFVQNVCENTGQQTFISMELQIINGNIFPNIKVNTISTLNQPIEGAVQSYIQSITNTNSIVSSFNKGEEYNNTAPVRTMIVGGKQQRLYQVKNTKYALKQSTLRYNPYTNQFIQIQHFGGFDAIQQYRAPDTANIRHPNFYTEYTRGADFIRVPLYAQSFNTPNNWGWPFGNTIIRGNYLPSTNVSPVGVQTTRPGGFEYPASDSDAICPYFGTNDITGVVRPVTSHYGKQIIWGVGTGGGTGFLIYFTNLEIAAAIDRNLGLNEYVRVSETEIRAAIAGFDSYVGFIAGVVFDTNGTGLDIWTKVLGKLLNRFQIKSFMNGMREVFNKFNNSQSGTQTIPNSPTSSILTDPVVFDILTKLHKYFQKIGQECYGKKYMISVPSPQYWRDRQPFEIQIQIGVTQDNQPIYLSEGGQKYYFSFEPTDSAWEEPYNRIDDSLTVGSAEMDLFTKEDGSIEPILAFNNTPQFNYAKALNKLMFDWIKNRATNNQLSEFWKFEAYRSAGLSRPDLWSLWESSLNITDKNKLLKGYERPILEAFNQPVPQNLVGKAYVKASVDKELKLYSTFAGLIVPKIIVSTDGMFLNPIDPNALSVQTAISEFLAEDYPDINTAERMRKILSINNYYLNPSQYISSAFDAGNPLSQDKSNKQFNNMSISPKAAIPGFAAIPVLINTSCYGPWVSAPDLQIANIFGADSPINRNRLENLVGGVNLEINNDLVPWNYGGMRVLDEVAALLVGQNNSYQLKGETGQLVIHGVPAFSLGQELKTASFGFRGPTINNIQVQISENGPSTTYSFRTFTRKFTLFNKENADRLKTIGQNSIKFGKESRERSRDILEKIRNLSGPSYDFYEYDLGQSKLRQYSPMSILVGYSSPYFSPKSNLSPQFYRMANWSGDSIRQFTTVTLQDARELSQEFEHLYSSKAFMSLDGLLHPVSFYPTFNASTTPYKKYFTSTDGRISGCPICGGTKQYIFSVAGSQPKTLYCDFCTDEGAGLETTVQSAAGGRLPPFILSNQADETILRNPNALNDLLQRDILSKKVNYVNLNPIIMPVGELRNKFAQDTDFNAHHIDVVGRSLAPPLGNISITSNLATFQNGLEFKDQNATDSDIDWNSIAFDSEIGRSPRAFQNNMRFLALRGPLVMAGWGFDSEGYPVPNASGEPKELNDDGYPKRISSLTDRDGGFENYIGSILGKNQVWNDEDGRWSLPEKENTFMKGWGLRPDTWPVGPIDLRWDETKRVWTSPQPYKLVDVQLEDNLVPPFPARGFLNAVDKNSPLPSGLRRMVFVKDSSESYGAPRGAKLLCYYDETTGFYEPVNKQNVITSGLIQSNGVAIIYNGYAKGFDKFTNEPEMPDPIRVEFNNFLNFSITANNQPGFFMFDKTQWMLLSTSSCS